MENAKNMAGRAASGALALLLVAGLSACGDKQEKSPGQAVASVNGTEITVLQLNDELQRAGVPAARQEEGSKQLLQSLIDRQLLLDAAGKDKIDRDPKVVQSIERARALIVAQAYMQKHLGTPTKATPQQVKEYYDQHPVYFTERRQLDMRQLVFATSEAGPDFAKAVDGIKTIDEAAALLEARKVGFTRAQVSRTTADLPPEVSQRLLALPKGQLFIVREGERSVLTQIVDIKPASVDLGTATPQIEQYRNNTRSKELATAEMARLRAAAKIEYLNKNLAPTPGATSAAGAAAPAAPVAAPGATDAADEAAKARGVSGLR
jgi:EpsD family peptidyl-prolyl cis-trans isomerase